MERASPSQNSRHLSVVATPKHDGKQRLTRAQVADRIGASVSTVRRYEGVLLHPHADDNGVHWFDPAEVTALAAQRANEHAPRRNTKTSSKTVDERTPGEIAAEVFERFEQRQSLAEIVIALRITPESVRALFDQWSVGLIEGQLRMVREPDVPRDDELQRASADTLANRLVELPAGQLTRISVARYRGPFQHGAREFAEIVELGGFIVSGPTRRDEITARFGRGDFRVTAYAFDPPGLRWELLVDGL